MGYVLRVENNITEFFWVEIGEYQLKIKVTRLAPYNATEASGGLGHPVQYMPVVYFVVKTLSLLI